MKTKLLGLLILTLGILSCSKNDSYSQSGYNGAPRHGQIPRSIFPDQSSSYDMNKTISGPLSDSLHKTAHDLFTSANMPGLSAALIMPGKGLWQIDTGFTSKPDQKKVNAATVFYWASVGKLITATIIEQLIEQKKISHDSKLSEWFPDIQYADKITIDELLLHMSGIYSYNNDPSTFSIHTYYSPDELIKAAAARKNLFRPGQYWSYSNTGYLLLALIAEKTEGKPFAEIVKQRISDPLQLSSFRALQPKEKPANLALAHEQGQVIPEDYSVPLGAGNFVSNAKDMVVLLHGLMTGKLGPVEGVYDRLKDLYPGFEKGSYFGRGLMLTDFNEINQSNNLWIGHSGGTQTYRALLIYDKNTKAFAAVAINAHISVEAVTMKLLAQVGY